MRSPRSHTHGYTCRWRTLVCRRPAARCRLRSSWVGGHRRSRVVPWGTTSMLVAHGMVCPVNPVAGPRAARPDGWESILTSHSADWGRVLSVRRRSRHGYCECVRGLKQVSCAGSHQPGRAAAPGVRRVCNRECEERPLATLGPARTTLLKWRGLVTVYCYNLQDIQKKTP